jgi:hypothetical protein
MPIHAIPFDFEQASAKTFHGKSQAFLAIETALRNYLGQAPSWVNLKELLRRIAAWRATKTGATIRDTAMQRLDQWLQGEIAALKPWPDRELPWGAQHNCYAYAMRCTDAVNGNNARPGRLAGNPRNQRSDDFAAGVVDDAHHQMRDAWILRQGGNPRPIPVLTHGGYLVVMTAIPMGYHFMRRNDATGFWTHKNGSIRDEETSWHDPDDYELEDAIDDAGMLKMITDPRLVEGNWTFEAYLEIQAGGIRVQG